MSGRPKVTIGIPVYNGENYIRQAIDSLLAQTFTDFELIISDNASTDKTEEICRQYAARENRIRYIRNQTNLGAAKNFNQLVALAQGEYFKWAAHDDICAPEFLAKCIEILELDPTIIVAYPRPGNIDEQGNVFDLHLPKEHVSSDRPYMRFFECICRPHEQTAVFGVMRTAILRQTIMIGAFSSSDRVLLGELTLRGRFYEVPEYLFFKRHHPQAHWKIYTTRHARQIWYDPRRKGKISFPHWRLLYEHLKTVHRVSINGFERVICYGVLVWWIRKHWRYLAKNLILKEPRVT